MKFRRTYRIVTLILPAMWALCVALPTAPIAAQDTESEDLEKVTLHLKWMHAFQFAGYYAAREQDYYQAEGLAVSINAASVGHQAVETVLAGGAEYGVWGSTLLNERLSGKPLVVLAVIFQHSPYIILSRKDCSIRVPSDLIGRTIMVRHGPGGAEFRAMLVHEGLSPDDVVVAPQAMGIADLIDGRIDAAMGYITDQPNHMRIQGVEPFIMRPIDYGIDFYGDCLFTTEEEIDRHPERVAAFRRASLKGWEYAMSHQEELIELILTLPDVTERGITAGHLRYEAEQMQELILPKLVEIGHMNPGRWKHIADTYVDLDMLDPDYSLAGFLYEPDSPADHRWLYALLFGLGGIALAAAIAWTWNNRLRSAVRLRTRELRESEERYRAVAEDTPVLICRFLPDGELTFANESYCTYFSKTSEELVGSSFLSLIPEADRESVMAGILAMTADSPNQSHEHRVIGPGGAIRWTRWTNRGQFDAQGRAITYQSIGEDITTRKQAEEERELLMQAIGQAAEAIVITDTEATIQYVNPAFTRITGYTREEAVSQNPRIPHSGEHDAAFYGEMWDTLTRGETWDGRLVNKKKNGTLYTEEAVISQVRDASGRTVNYVAVKRDITDEIELEGQLRQAQKMESVGRLAGGVAHDLNNLLSPILGYGEMLLDGLGANDARRESVDQILRAGFLARDLVRQLSAFSRKQILEYRPVDLNKAVTDFEKLLRRTIREDIAIEIIAAPNIRTIMADIGQIEQVIMNLAVNAADAMPEGGHLTIETSPADLDEEYAAKHPAVQPGRFVMLAMSDTGCGMDHETREHLFEPFFSTKGEQGTGLGLATVYGIVKQHGGYIWVYSEPGSGATFKVYLPASDEVHVEEEVGQKTPTGLKGSETILLVEDNEQVRDLAHTILKRQGYTVLVAGSGPEALAILTSHHDPVHLLLTDVVMPGMHGKELFTRAIEERQGLRVLYMSGYTANVIAHRGVLDEGVAFIQKPFTVQALTAKVREVLEHD